MTHFSTEAPSADRDLRSGRRLGRLAASSLLATLLVAVASAAWAGPVPVAGIVADVDAVGPVRVVAGAPSVEALFDEPLVLGSLFSTSAFSLSAAPVAPTRSDEAPFRIESLVGSAPRAGVEASSALLASLVAATVGASLFALSGRRRVAEDWHRF